MFDCLAPPEARARLEGCIADLTGEKLPVRKLFDNLFAWATTAVQAANEAEREHRRLIDELQKVVLRFTAIDEYFRGKIAGVEERFRSEIQRAVNEQKRDTTNG